MTATRTPPRRQIVIVAFPGVQLLDVAGPSDVFALANAFAAAPAYTVRVAASGGGLVRTVSGVSVDAVALGRIAPGGVDTALMAGGDRDGLVRAVQDERLRRWVCRVAARARRIGSVCSGAFALAHWGLLDGARATTHWSAAALLRRHYPAVSVDGEALYVQDGRLWTSGGVTAGIDMCLAMVEADLGRMVAARVAKQLVLSVRRVGNQSQYSVELQTQAGRYADLVDWVRAHVRQPIDVPRMAQQAGESERSFQRRFTAETGLTPAAFVEQLRLQRAKQCLEGGVSVKSAARSSGFTSDEHLARVFRRRLNMSPVAYRQLHGGGGSAAL